jgi:hypothetical protein
MVRNARNPGGSIRPILGPVFAAQQYTETPEIVESEERVVSSGRVESVATQDADRPRVVEEPRRETGPPAFGVVPIVPMQRPAPVPAGTSPKGEDGSIPEERTTFRPLVPQTRQDPIEQPGIGLASIEAAQSNAGGGTAVPQRQSSPERTETRVVLKPPTAEKLRVPDPTVLREARQPMTPAAGRKRERDLSGRSGMPAREPDEIQIHIGRIEVTAAPTAPVRAAPKPTNKSLDLGAYLKRRDGGAR